jgi:DNA mismatch endonuclease (patch repair protein)
MAAQRRRDTEPELRLRAALHAMGLRYRVAYAVPGKARRSIDVAFPRRKVAVFVDGCFWHACPAHGTSPRRNAAWWKSKLDRNVERDRQTDALLIDAGWVVLRFWEHEDMQVSAEQVRVEVRRRA